MAIDLSAVFSEKINKISHDHGGLVTSRGISSPIKSPTSKTTSTLPTNSLFTSLLSQNNLQIGKKCEQTKQLTEGAKALYDSIDIIKKSLIENRRDYIDMYGSLYQSKLSDEDRNQIDEEVQEGIVECQARLVVLKNQVKEKGPRLGSQRHAVISAIIESCELYLKNVCDTFTELRSFRMKRSFDKRKLTRLDRGYDFDIDSTPENPQLLSPSPLNHSQRRGELEGRAELSYSGGSFNSEIDQMNDADSFDTPSNELISLQEENEKIYQNFCSMVGETRQVQKSLAQIAKLNRTFQENFLLQNEDIQRVQTTAFQTSANIKDGNEELRGAIRNKARAIYWIIFVNLVLTFSLIFLDWYNI